MSNKPPELIAVFSGTFWEAGLVQSMLTDNGIQSFLKDEVRGSTSISGITSAAGGVKITISSNDFQAAKTIIEEYQKNIK